MPTSLAVGVKWARWQSDRETGRYTTSNRVTKRMHLRTSVCKRCNTEMQPGKAMEQTWRKGIEYDEELGGTMSPGGSGKLMDVMKCPACGYSVANA